MLKDAALSVNDTVIFDGNTPGGYTFQGHSTNATSLSKIMMGDWDYVVLQEQSQMPSFPDQQVASEVFPYAQKLDSIVKRLDIVYQFLKDEYVLKSKGINRVVVQELYDEYKNYVP
jgi:hypothetical protein